MMPVLLVLSLLGCKKTNVQPDVPSQVPKNLAPAVPALDGDPYPQTPPVFTCGEGRLEEENQDYDWCHGRAYVKQPIDVTIEAQTDPRVAADYCQAEIKPLKRDFDPDHEWSLLVHHTARSDLAEVEYTVKWVCDRLDEEPPAIVCGFGKTEGSALFPYFEGTIALIEVEEGITEWQYVEQIKAPTVDAALIKGTITDIHGEILAFIDDKPYAPCENWK